MPSLMRNYAVVFFALVAGLLVFAFFNPQIGERLPLRRPGQSSPQTPSSGSSSSPPTASSKDGAADKYRDASCHNGYMHGQFNNFWDPARDARNLGLTAEQCDIAFEGLFDKLDERKESTKREGLVTRKYMEEIDSSSGDIGGFIHGYIWDNNLYVTKFKRGYFTRAIALVASMHRAMLTSPEPLPNIQFTYFSTDDSHNYRTWGLTHDPADTRTWLMPDFGYWSWPEPKVSSYSAVQRRARQVEEGHAGQAPGETVYDWAHKIPKLVWRGAKGMGTTRGALVDKSQGKSWADVKNIVWAPDQGHKDILAMSDHCKYKYVAHTAGSTYSGRLKYLQNCRSVIVAHALEWQTHAMHLMQKDGDGQNFVEVQRDYSDLDATMQKLINDDAWAEKIADNNVKTFRDRYLSPAAEVCYWRRLIRNWSEVSEPPVPWEGQEGTMDWKGVPAEDFLMMHATDWEQH